MSDHSSQSLDTPPPSLFSTSPDLDMLPSAEDSLWADEVPGFSTEPYSPDTESIVPPASNRPSLTRRAAVGALGLITLGAGAGAAKLLAAHSGQSQRRSESAAESTKTHQAAAISAEGSKGSSALEQAYNNANVEQQSTPFDFVSGSHIADQEKEDTLDSIERNHAEFVTGIKLSSGLTLNFYQAHITPADRQDKLQVDGRAVEQLFDYVLKSGAELPDTNPFSTDMKKINDRAQNGQLDSNITVIISTRGECLDPDSQEIIDDDMGLKGICKDGSAYGAEINLDEDQTKQNIRILLSDIKVGTVYGLSSIAADETVQQANFDPNNLIKGDALAVGLGHELTHAVIATLGKRELSSDEEHKLLVYPLQSKVAKYLLQTGGEGQKGQNRFISPVHVVRGQ